jgi:hypothetical protein
MSFAVQGFNNLMHGVQVACVVWDFGVFLILCWLRGSTVVSPCHPLGVELRFCFRVVPFTPAVPALEPPALDGDRDPKVFGNGVVDFGVVHGFGQCLRMSCEGM